MQATERCEDRPRAKLRAILLGVLITAVFSSYIGVTYGFGFDLFSLIIPDMKADLGFTYADAGYLSASSRLGFMFGGLFAGLFVPRLGAGRTIVASALVSSIAMMLMSFVSAVWGVSALLFILGLCAATVYIPMVVVIGRFVATHHKSKALGAISSGQSLFVFLNGFIAPMVLLQYDWRMLWLLIGVASVVGTLLTALFLFRIDVLQSPRDEAARAASEAPPAGAGAAPMRTDRRITGQIVLIWALIFFSGFVTQPYQTYLPSLVRDELGLPLVTMGTIWSTIGFIGIWSGFLLGSLADRFSVRHALGLCYLFLFSGCAVLATQTEPTFLIAAAVLYGLAFYPIYALIPVYISKIYDANRAIFIFGIANMFLGLGGALGNLLGGVSRTIFGTFTDLYIFGAAICCGLGVILLLLRREHAPIPAPGPTESGTEA